MLLFLGAQGQLPHQEDSSRIIVLQEVNIAGKQQTQQDKLFYYFNANKAATTEDLLARIPQLSLVRRGSYGMEPVIRSFNAAQVNLLLDGMRIHGACTDRMDPASIYVEPANLSAIDVRTGGSSFLTGSSVGGSINMKLAEIACHDENRFFGNATSGFHSVSNAFFQSLNLNYAGQKWGLKATGTYRKSNNYKDGSGQTVSFSQYEKLNYSLHGRYQLNEHTYLKAFFLTDEGWNIGYAALPMDVGYANAKIGSVGIVRENTLKDWNKMELKLYANKVKHYMDDTRRPNVSMHMDMPGESLTYGAYAEGTRSKKRSLLSLRADISATALHASMTMYQTGQTPMYMLTWPDNRQLQSGLAAQYMLRLDSLTQLQLSTRADMSTYSLTTQMAKDQTEVFGNSTAGNQYFIPSLAVQLTRQMTPKLKGTLSLQTNGRAPSAAEIYGFYLFNQFDIHDYIGNTDLKSERGQQAELSMTWQATRIRVQASGYISKVSNYILGMHRPELSVMTIGAKGVKQYQNIDHAILAGAEASIVCRPFSKTQLVSTLKYAYGQAQDGAALPMISPLRNITSVRRVFDKLWLQAEAELAAAQNKVSLIANERKTGAFSLYHLRVGYELYGNNLRWTLNVGVENIFNTQYREHLDWGNIARPGRNIYVQAGVNF